jgi:hypothetical protein
MALAEKLALMGSHFHSPQQIGYLHGRQRPGFHGSRSRIGLTAWVIADK